MNDIEIQVHAIVEKSLKDLKTKYPRESFDLIIRDFSPAIHIEMRRTQLSELIFNVFEEFVLDSPSAEGTLLYKNGRKMDYEKNVAFLKELKNTPLLEELIKTTGYNHLIHWTQAHDNQEHFFGMIQNKYPRLFNHLEHDTTIMELTNVLKAAIERRYRSDAINYHIRDISGIEQKLLGVYDWHINMSKKWFEQIKGYMPDYAPIGYQKLTLTEVAPYSRIGELGEIGGKTVKIGNFSDMELEVTFSQRDALGQMILEIMPDKLQEIRDMSLQMFVARRFIFDGAINKIIDFENRKRGYAIEGLDVKNPLFREAMYCSFMNHSQDHLFNLHKAFNIVM